MHRNENEHEVILHNFFLSLQPKYHFTTLSFYEQNVGLYFESFYTQLWQLKQSNTELLIIILHNSLPCVQRIRYLLFYWQKNNSVVFKTKNSKIVFRNLHNIAFTFYNKNHV